MGHFSMEIDAPTGSNLSGNQHLVQFKDFQGSSTYTEGCPQNLRMKSVDRKLF